MTTDLPPGFERKLIVNPYDTYDAIVPVSAPIPGSWGDWPPAVQDRILQAVAEQIERPIGFTRVVTRAICEADPDGAFLRISISVLPDWAVKGAKGTA